jgi:hypothetical protein
MQIHEDSQEKQRESRTPRHHCGVGMSLLGLPARTTPQDAKVLIVRRLLVSMMAYFLNLL